MGGFHAKRAVASNVVSPPKSHQLSDHVKEGRQQLDNTSFSISSFWPFKKRTDRRRVAIIGFGNAGLLTAYRFLKDGYSVCVYDLKVGSTRIQQIIDAELPRMLNGFTFGLHLKQYTVSELDTILKRFSVAADLEELVSTGSRIIVECIPEVLEDKQQLFADLTELLCQRSVPACDIVLCSCTLTLSIPSIALRARAPYKSRLIAFPDLRVPALPHKPSRMRYQIV